MKKNFFLFLILLPLLLTACGDEFGSLRVSNDTYIMFPLGNEPEKVEVMVYDDAGTVVRTRHDMEYLSSTTEYGRYQFEYYKKEFNTSIFMKQYEQTDPKPEIFFLFDSEQLSTRKNYTYRIVFFFTDSSGSIEEEEITIYIPYFEDGDTKKLDLILETKKYGKIPVLFCYYFTRSI